MNERKRGKIMSKRARQYIGILAAVIVYYLVHEGALLLPEWAARIGFGALLIVNGLVFWKLVLPVYSRCCIWCSRAMDSRMTFTASRSPIRSAMQMPE